MSDDPPEPPPALEPALGPEPDFDLPELSEGLPASLAPAIPRATDARPNLAPLLDVPVTVEAVLGRVSLTVDELLSLEGGSVIDVDRRVGEPIDLVVGGRTIARGELVLIDGALGLTLTEIVKRDA